MLQDNSSAANVSQIKFDYSQARILLNKTKKRSIAHYRKEICLYSKFFNDISPNSQDKFRFKS